MKTENNAQSGKHTRIVKLPRRLDDRSKKQIAVALRTFPHISKVNVIAISGDSERLLFAQQIRDFLDVTGWITDPEISTIHHAKLPNGTVIQLNDTDKEVAEIIVGSNNQH